MHAGPSLRTKKKNALKLKENVFAIMSAQFHEEIRSASWEREREKKERKEEEGERKQQERETGIDFRNANKTLPYAQQEKRVCLIIN